MGDEAITLGTNMVAAKSKEKEAKWKQVCSLRSWAPYSGELGLHQGDAWAVWLKSVDPCPASTS